MVICFVHKDSKFRNLCSKIVTFGKTIILLIKKTQTVNTFKMTVFYKNGGGGVEVPKM